MSDQPAMNMYREVLLDSDLQALRREFVAVAAKALSGVAGWVGFDSFLGGGDLSLFRPGDGGPQDPDRHMSFRAAAAARQTRRR